MRENWKLPVLLIALDAFQTLRQPVRKREIDRFIEVQLTKIDISPIKFNAGEKLTKLTP